MIGIHQILTKRKFCYLQAYIDQIVDARRKDLEVRNSGRTALTLHASTALSWKGNYENKKRSVNSFTRDLGKCFFASCAEGSADQFT